MRKIHASELREGMKVRADDGGRVAEFVGHMDTGYGAVIRWTNEQFVFPVPANTIRQALIAGEWVRVKHSKKDQVSE